MTANGKRARRRRAAAGIAVIVVMLGAAGCGSLMPPPAAPTLGICNTTVCVSWPNHAWKGPRTRELEGGGTR